MVGQPATEEWLLLPITTLYSLPQIGKIRRDGCPLKMSLHPSSCPISRLGTPLSPKLRFATLRQVDNLAALAKIPPFENNTTYR